MAVSGIRQGVLACAFGAAALVMPAASHAAASLIGDEVAIGYFFPTFDDMLGMDTVIVNDGFEAICPGASFVCDILLASYGIDIGANTIEFVQIGTTEPYNEADVNGWLFSGLDFGRGIGGVTLTAVGLPGLTQDDVFFNEDSIFVSLLDVTSPVSDPNGFRLELIEIPAPPEPIPLPAAALGLAGAVGALGALGALTARRRRAGRH